MQQRFSWRWMAGGAAVYAALQAAGAAWPGGAAAFIAPSARLAATLLRIPLAPGAEPVLVHPGYPVQVVASCSGWDFFSLLAALLVGRALLARTTGGRPRAALLLALPVAALVTVVVNAGRLVAVVAGGLHVLPHLPPLAAVSFHTGLGVAVFLPSLILTFVLWERNICHDRVRC